jgi:hypothetical protein
MKIRECIRSSLGFSCIEHYLYAGPLRGYLIMRFIESLLFRIVRTVPIDQLDVDALSFT